MGSVISNFKGEDNPVEIISWDDAKKFINQLNQMEDPDKYRLPSEAEWEYACRAGTTSEYFFGNDRSKLCNYAWCRDNSDYTTHPVGLKKPNQWGIYDMYGNVWEWCEDEYHANYIGAPANVSAWENYSHPDDSGSDTRIFRTKGAAAGFATPVSAGQRTAFQSQPALATSLLVFAL